jgi:PAS domain S-box-containing protein
MGYQLCRCGRWAGLLLTVTDWGVSMKDISDSSFSESLLAELPPWSRPEKKEEQLRKMGVQPPHAQRFRPIGGWRSLGVLWLAFLVMAGTGVIINVLTRRADEDRSLQRSLVLLEANAREMDALEWKTIFNGKLDGELAERLEEIRNAMAAGIDKLQRLEPTLPELHAVADKYKTYSKLVDEEFRFLADGKIKEAQEIDATKVDPAFEGLHKAIAETENAFDRQASRTLALVRAGTFLVLLAALGFVATLFWHYHQRRRAGEVAAAEQRVLNLLRAIMEGTTDAIFAKDREGRYLMINTAGARFVGKKPDEMIGLDDTQCFSDETRARIIERDRALMKTGETRTDENISTTLAGVSRVYLTTKGALRDSAGAIIGLFGVARDITERKQTEEALAAQVLRYQTLMETSADSIYVLNERGDLQEANAAFLRGRGYSAAEAKGLNVADWDARWTHEQLQELLQEKLRKVDDDTVFETRHRCKDGSLLEVEVSVTRVRIGGEQLFFCVTRDITERKRVEQSQRESQLRYETLVQSIDGIVWEADPQTFMFTFVSQQAERILGYPVKDWFERASFWPDHMHPEDRDWAVKFCVDATARGEDHQFEYRMIAANGRVVWLNDIVTLHVLPDQSVILRGLMVDITERKWEEALLKGQKQVLELIATGASLPASLSALARVIEAQSPEMLCSVLLLDDDGTHLLSGAAPSLPDAFTRTIDGVAIGANVGSCGTAAFRREAVFVEDIAVDPLWANYREVALPHGLRACWSTPIFDARKKLLGTFAIYYRQPGLPTALHIRLIERATQTAAIAISRQRTEEELQQVNEQLRVLSRRLFQVRDDERRHLARELHDEIGQALTAVKINLDSIEPAEGSSQSLRLKEASAILDKLLWQVRQISLDLHSSLIDDLGLAPALRSLLDQQARRGGLRTQFCADEPLENVDPEIQTTGFRIAQEAITNVLRHAKAQSLSVHLRTESGKLRMKIVDDGTGFSLAEVERRARPEGGFGLLGMRERAALVGGRVQIISSTDKGTRVEVSLPLNAADEAP